MPTDQNVISKGGKWNMNQTGSNTVFRSISTSPLITICGSTENFGPNNENQELPEKSTEIHQNKSCTRNYLNSFKGLIYTFLCSLFITFSSVFVKKLVYISPGELSLIRNIGVFVGCIPFVVYTHENPLGPKKQRIVLYLRNIMAATALYLNLLAYRLLPLSVAAIIMSTLPAIVMVSARIFLKEPCGIIQTLALALSVAGILISIKLPELILNNEIASESGYNYVVGISCALGCVILLSGTIVSLRSMKDIHFSILLLNLGFFGIIENAALTAGLSFYAWPRCGWDSYQVMLIGVFGFLGHCFLTLAIQAETAGIVSVIKSSSDIVVALIFQIIFFNNIPDVYNLSGAFLVIVSVGIVGIRKWIFTLPDESTVRKKLKFFLL